MKTWSFLKKEGMTSLWDGASLIPVTVLRILKTKILGDAKSESKHKKKLLFIEEGPTLCKPAVGILKKHGAEGKKGILKESFMEGENPDWIREGIFLDVQAEIKGRGFLGVVKRYGFKGNRASHGASACSNQGSTGMREWPAKVMKGKRMAGRKGGVNATIQNLLVVRIMGDLVMIKGSVPGPKGRLVGVVPAVKKGGIKNESK